MYFYFKYVPPMMEDEITSYVCKHGDNLFLWFPENENNPIYQQYLAWLEEGNTPEEWKPE